MYNYFIYCIFITITKKNVLVYVVPVHLLDFQIMPSLLHFRRFSIAVNPFAVVEIDVTIQDVVQKIFVATVSTTVLTSKDVSETIEETNTDTVSELQALLNAQFGDLEKQLLSAEPEKNDSGESMLSQSKSRYLRVRLYNFKILFSEC